VDRECNLLCYLIALLCGARNRFFHPAVAVVKKAAAYSALSKQQAQQRLQSFPAARLFSSPQPLRGLNGDAVAHGLFGAFQGFDPLLLPSFAPVMIMARPLEPQCNSPWRMFCSFSFVGGWEAGGKAPHNKFSWKNSHLTHFRAHLTKIFWNVCSLLPLRR